MVFEENVFGASTLLATLAWLNVSPRRVRVKTHVGSRLEVVFSLKAIKIQIISFALSTFKRFYFLCE
ncbi:hypothetical protein PCASD_10357 [Puccinia coronata f. sp. avenae]|uniref:Uncharacterized protein n=1 Tax=Puccinia coronata f. sp. avenae TaxID=200324 RepID=A0A2N5TCC4_9BASI|nr:hypothetical protein PCASD_15250 [Puccinia coronata f. sp. avenae]PLW38439.1 hypothetical protein PCASD_10357 [Puccinia coronata f. sp. avenae]